MKAVKGGTQYKDPEIKRVVINHIKIYEVKEEELELLYNHVSKGSKTSWGMSFISFSISILISILTVDFSTERQESYFISACIVTLAFGIYLLIDDKSKKRKIDIMYKNIKQREFNEQN